MKSRASTVACALLLFACNSSSSSSAAEPPAASPQSEPAPSAPAPAEVHSQGAQPPAAEPSTGQAADETGAGAGALEAGGLRWKAPPPPLTARTPSSRMRAAEYVAKGDAGEAVLAVYFFGAGQGGTVQANLDRWIAQFSQPDGSDSKQAAKIESRKVGGLPVTVLDLSGTFTNSMGGPSMTGGQPEPDQRILGAIVEAPKGPVFFKLVGPAATVEQAAPAFEALVGSFEAK